MRILCLIGLLIMGQLSVAETVLVTGMREVIDDLTIENSGSFYRYNGDVIPW